MRCIRILIVDDMPAVRDGLRTVLRLEADRTGLVIEPVGEARNGEEAVQQARDLHPDVILMDLELPLLDGFEATRQIKNHCPAARVVILSIHSSEEVRQRARAAGANSFVEKGAALEHLMAAILASDGWSQSPRSEQGERS